LNRSSSITSNGLKDIVAFVRGQPPGTEGWSCASFQHWAPIHEHTYASENHPSDVSGVVLEFGYAAAATTSASARRAFQAQGSSSATR
jgi:hypothetical protein